MNTDTFLFDVTIDLDKSSSCKRGFTDFLSYMPQITHCFRYHRVYFCCFLSLLTVLQLRDENKTFQLSYIGGVITCHFCQQKVWFHRAKTFSNACKGRFPAMAENTRMLAANIRRQFLFVITTTVNTRCLVENFQLICYSQRVNATSQYDDSSSSSCSKWPNDRMVAVVKHCCSLYKEEEAAEKDD